ncbi:MAG TPA: polyprenyl synthetase family protein [Ruminiclostridium sp.]
MTKENIEKQNNIEHITYSTAMDLVKKEIYIALSTAPILIRKYTEHLMTSSGKNIRAIALITCAENEDGFIHPHAIKFAAAIELLHLATLVHDDVIDNANIRRGDLTLQKKYGKRTAVICGDYLFCMALKLAAAISNKEDYLKLDMPDYMSRVCLGELNQHVNSGFLDLSVYQYLKIISGKTAALFEASFYAGAILSENDKLAMRKYMRLGRYIGMIFQMADDCMDFETTENIAKKPVQSDFEQGVVTLPLIYAFKNMIGFKEKAKNNQLSRNDINAAVAKTGGLSFTRMVSKKYYDKALIIINELKITETKRIKLISILDKASGLS